VLALSVSFSAHTAAAQGDVELLRSALEADPEAIVRRQGPGQLTPLMLASLRGHVGAVSCLLNAGAHPNAVNVNGETALMFAASARWPDVVRVLIAAGAHVDPWDALGLTALHKAVLGGRPQERTSAADTVRALLDGGADASMPDRRGKLAHEYARARRWRWTVPLLGWQLSGWYPVSRKDVLVRMLEDAASPEAR